MCTMDHIFQDSLCLFPWLFDPMSFFYYWHAEEVVLAFSPLLVYFGTLLHCMSITTNVSLKKLKAHLTQQFFSFYVDNTMSRCYSQTDYCLCPPFWHVDYRPSLYI
ncbi:unnamed protein product [Mucor circinelloides]